ncbi:alpha-1,3-mannosyl-glycoprotein 2-beta-N-acetylglucosaminyltransferase [Culicoides brevitarsis]|uniref:alpha-1,3-mannosyl-glycoprotein 2-beta-N-acetylglucosaminyltransferase n=1 Tax=Culicoides brevitarsis TaxID=469753 RepID=UPI00307C8F3F
MKRAPAMRPRKIFFVILAIAIWMLVTYIIVTKQSTQNEARQKQMMKDVELIEMEAHDKMEERKYLLEQITKILKMKELPDEVPLIQTTTTKKPVKQQDEPVLSNDVNEVIQEPEDEDPLARYTQTYLDNDHARPVIPVLVFACNRPSIAKCLDNLVQYRRNKDQFPIIVSQDCGDELTKETILKYKDEVTLIEQPDTSIIQVPPKDKKFLGYYKISRHYGWALNQVFSRGFEFVIIVEDDLNVAPDFYEYFYATYPLLRNDSSLWCVSAWNDNGKVGLIDEDRPDILYRTDFFPGLGWMLNHDLWNELSEKWPKAFWDDWIRTPQQRKERACIRPEISRTRTFGKVGVSNGLFYEKHLKFIKLSEDPVPFGKMNLTYLLKDNYDKQFIERVYQCPVITFEELRRGLAKNLNEVRVQYNTKDQYKRICKLLGLMDDFRSGVGRTAYRGIVTFFYNEQRVHLAPNINWKGYDPSWS